MKDWFLRWASLSRASRVALQQQLGVQWIIDKDYRPLPKEEV